MGTNASNRMRPIATYYPANNGYDGYYYDPDAECSCSCKYIITKWIF